MLSTFHGLNEPLYVSERANDSQSKFWGTKIISSKEEGEEEIEK